MTPDDTVRGTKEWWFAWDLRNGWVEVGSVLHFMTIDEDLKEADRADPWVPVDLNAMSGERGCSDEMKGLLEDRSFRRFCGGGSDIPTRR